MECPRCQAAIVVPPPDPAGENPIALRLCACCEQLLDWDAFAKRRWPALATVTKH
ncbi:hypothetical protein F441_12660 [Phytophthora nicotianae CJ01A1]|uniref:Uncharacterized protein n=1 Tax=Phytophthora nicotianae CJ01A1 TaxID=1317063 RepID=W2WN10_PHYNI|nr:hypothetical protein F441_12660 [Phytophthora nicotianae CJ01A1]